MLKLKSCRGELLMLSIVPTDAASYRLSFSHTHTHTRTCAHTQTQLQSPVACADRKQRTCHSVWIWGMCKCSVVSGPNERDVCSCCLNGECSVCAQCVCMCVCVTGLGKIHMCRMPKYRLQRLVIITLHQGFYTRVSLFQCTKHAQAFVY